MSESPEIARVKSRRYECFIEDHEPLPWTPGQCAGTTEEGGVAMGQHQEFELFHYTEKPTIALDQRHYPQDLASKPGGFWVSVGDSWEEWCLGEDFRIESLEFRQSVRLRKFANILVLDSAPQIDEFNRVFGKKSERYGAIDWPAVARKYQGIIIAPYCWERRNYRDTFWYYTWDCASGCIWDLSAIEAHSEELAISKANERPAQSAGEVG